MAHPAKRKTSAGFVTIFSWTDSSWSHLKGFPRIVWNASMDYAVAPGTIPSDRSLWLFWRFHLFRDLQHLGDAIPVAGGAGGLQQLIDG